MSAARTGSRQDVLAYVLHCLEDRAAEPIAEKVVVALEDGNPSQHLFSALVPRFGRGLTRVGEDGSSVEQATAMGERARNTTTAVLYSLEDRLAAERLDVVT